jgi:hypothetical protein
MLTITTAHIYGLLAVVVLWFLPTILVVRIALIARIGHGGSISSRR